MQGFQGIVARPRWKFWRSVSCTRRRAMGAWWSCVRARGLFRVCACANTSAIKATSVYSLLARATYGDLRSPGRTLSVIFSEFVFAAGFS